MGKAAARYCNGKRLDQLNGGEVELLYNRLVTSREQSAAGKARNLGDDVVEPDSEKEIYAGTGEDWSPDDREADGADEASKAPVRSEISRLESGPTLSAARSNGRSRG
jgi:hypothetical protein